MLEAKVAELEKQIAELQGARDDSEVCCVCVCAARVCACVCARNFWPFTQEKNALETQVAEQNQKFAEVQEVCCVCVLLRVCVRA